jgi:hypothetical protein
MYPQYNNNIIKERKFKSLKDVNSYEPGYNHMTLGEMGAGF